MYRKKTKTKVFLNNCGVCGLTAEVISVVSLQRNLRLAVRELLITSYTMTPLAHTPSSSSPNTGFFSRAARWNSTPYSGSCWTLCGGVRQRCQVIWTDYVMQDTHQPSSHPEKLLRPNGVGKNIWPAACAVIMGLNKCKMARWKAFCHMLHKQMQLSHFPFFSFFIFTPKCGPQKWFGHLSHTEKCLKFI